MRPVPVPLITSLLPASKVRKRGSWDWFPFLEGVKGPFRYLILSLIFPTHTTIIKPFCQITIWFVGRHYTLVPVTFLDAQTAPETPGALIRVFVPQLSVLLGPRCI